MFREMLVKLTSKNLEGQVEYGITIPVGWGGQRYVYAGRLRVSDRRVAFKDIRVLAQQFLDVQKVCLPLQLVSEKCSDNDLLDIFRKAVSKEVRM